MNDTSTTVLWKETVQGVRNGNVNAARITETSPYSFGNFRKLLLYNCLIPIQLINSL